MNGSSELTCPTSLNDARPSRALAQNIERGVGVAAQAVARHAIHHALCHQLGDDVEPARQKIGRSMGVVGGNIVLLRERHVQPFAGQEKELDHLDVRRQRARMQRARIGKIRIAAEQPVDHRTDEALFKQTARPRLFQRQRGKQGQLDGAVGDRTGVERVDDVVGLAEPERQSDHEVGSDIADDVFRDRVGVGKQLWASKETRPNMNGPSPWNRTPALARAIAYLSSDFVCDEPATAKHRIPVVMSRGRLPVAAAAP